MYTLTAVIDEHMNPEQLLKAVAAGDKVEAPDDFPGVVYAAVQLFHFDGKPMYVMWGLTGKHTLNPVFTDAERLHVHWQGFKENNKIEAIRQGFRSRPSTLVVKGFPVLPSDVAAMKS